MYELLNKVNLNKGKQIKLDVNKHYFNVVTALEDLGYIYYCDYYNKNYTKKYTFYKKDNKIYRIKVWERFNTLIYSITLKEVII